MKSKIMVAGSASILFLGIFIGFSSIGICGEGKSILFVGGTGLGNYSSIQSAIAATSNGDKIFVYSGNYFENLVLNKSITIIGEGGLNTIINGNGSGDTVVISADNVCIINLTIKNEGAGGTGINIRANYSVISENIIVNNNWSGIETGSACRNCTVSKNTIMNNGYGIFFNKETLSINISGNIVSNNNFDGIYLDHSINGIVTDNVIDNNGDDGINPIFSNNIVIYGNFIRNNRDNGFYLYSSETTINGNTITNNSESGIFLRNSNESQIVWNNIFRNNKGIEVTFLSCNNIVNNNSITNNDIGIYSSADAGSNNFSDNSFSDNNADVKKESSKTPGFEIIITLLSMTFVIFYRAYKR